MCSFKICICLLGCAGSSVIVAVSQGYSSCSAWASHSSGLSYCRARALAHGLQWLWYGLSSCTSWALEHRFNSRVLGRDCSVACGIFPDQDQIHASCIGKWILYH